MTPIEILERELGAPLGRGRYRDLRALTFWRPWPSAILDAGKRVENRRRPPPESVLGEEILIHASARYDVGDWRHPGGWAPPAPEECPTGIVGIARVLGYLDVRGGAGTAVRTLLAPADLTRLDDDPWWAGPVGILLADPRAFSEAIQCPGAQGYWRAEKALKKASARAGHGRV